MNENELYHFGVKGMKWGVRRNRSSFVSTSGPKRLPGTYASDGNGWNAKAKRLPGAIVKKDVSFRTRRLQRAVNANNRDVKSLKSAGYKKEAAAVKAVGDKNRAKLAKSQARDAARNTPEAKAAREEKLKKAAKVGAAVAGTALAVYGAYKLNKYLNSEVHKKYAAETKRYLKIADGQEKLAKQASTWASESRSKASYNAFQKSTFNHDIRAAKARDTAYKYWDKADQTSYSTREKYDVAKDLAKGAYQTYKNRRTRK